MTTLFRRLIRCCLRRADGELAEEIETHRQLTEHRLRASGMSPAEAAAESRRLMGNVALAREDARAVWIAPWLDGVWQDMAYALRMLRRAPAFAAAMILVLALGIGATVGVIGLVDALVFRSLPVAQPDRLVYFTQPSFSYPVFQEVRARGSHVFSSLAAWNMDSVNVAWSRELEPAEILTASGEFYSTLGVGATVGRTFGPGDDRIGGGRDGLVAVLSHAAWQRRFGGDASAVGRTIRIEQDTFTIVGVTPPGFFGVAPGLAPEITIPLTSTADAGSLGSTTSSWVHLLGRLRDSVTLAEANTALRSFWPAVLEATTNSGMPSARRAVYLGRTTELASGRAGFSRVRNQFVQPLWLLLGLAGLLLAIACASGANLLLARGVARHREIAVRLAVGAGRWRLVRQMLTEALVWTALAAAGGLLLAVWGAGTLVRLMSTSQEPIAVDVAPNWRILTFSITLTLVTSLLCSIIPALRATRLHAATGLKDAQISRSVLRRWSLGKSLVAAQVALTVLLVFGASLFVRSLGRVLSQDAGVERDSVLVLAVDAEAVGYDGERLAAFFDQLRQRLAGIPGIQSASLSFYPPISDEDGAWTQGIAVDGLPVPDEPGRSSVYFNAISPDYFRTIGMRLVRGRDFTASDMASAAAVAIVNESLARRFFPGQDPVGRRLTAGRNKNRRDLQIIAVVSDAKYQRLQEEPRSIVYLPWTQRPAENLFVEVRSAGSMALTAERVRREVRALDAAVPIRLETVSDRIRESLVTERVIALLATALGIAAIALACAALYGLLAYAVSRATPEIGLRVALGAQRAEVLRLIMRESLILAVIGIALGLGGSLALGRFARPLLFHVSPRDPLSLVTAGAVMLAVALLAAFLPARRAARVDPVVALRSE